MPLTLPKSLLKEILDRTRRNFTAASVIRLHLSFSLLLLSYIFLGDTMGKETNQDNKLSMRILQWLFSWS